MIHIAPRLLFVLTLFFVGPSREAASLIAIAGILVLALALRRSFQYRTVALLGILGIMFLESLQLVFASFRFDLFGERLFDDGVWNLFSTLFTLNVGLTLVGALAAAVAGAYIEFGKSRMALAQIFPQFKFLEAPIHVRDVVQNLASSAGIQPPDVWLVDSGTPSAFTVRSNRKYAVAVSVGLLESLDEEEMNACLAHEISHLKNNDFTWRFLATLAKVALFAKPLSYLIEPAVYRAREFLADKTAAKLVGGPGALISALSKLAESQALRTSTFPATVCACNFHMGKGFLSIFDKQPDIHSRISALQEIHSQ